MESQLGYYAANAALEWQLELGADEAIGDAPIDRYSLPKETSARARARPSQVVQSAQPVTLSPSATGVDRADPPDPVAAAYRAAEAAHDLAMLRAAMEAYEHCDLKRGARKLVFGDGMSEARLMIIGEAPGREDDIAGKPFAGRAGQLLDRMLDAIDMGRSRAEAPVYITNVLPWRPPQNRNPKPEEIAMMLPFLERHVGLVNPELVILMGDTACQAILGKRGITRLRGQWVEAFGRPAMPMFHPDHLLGQPASKREAWMDLLNVRAQLERVK